MNKLRSLLLVILGISLCFPLNAQYNPVREDAAVKRDSISNIVNDQANLLFNYAKIQYPVFLSDIEDNCFIPNTGIILNRSYLKSFYTKKDNAEFTFIVRFLLSHELGHAIQFLSHKSSFQDEPRCEYLKLYECEADFFAGELISNFYFNGKEKLTKDIFFKWLNFVADLGEPSSSQNSHPSWKERTNAFKYGFGNGANDKYSPLSIELAKLRKSLGKSYRLQRYEEYLIFSESLCPQIIHFHNTPGADILEVDEKAVYDTSATHPIVIFSQTLMNSGQRPVKLRFDPYVSHVPRHDIDLEATGGPYSPAYILAYAMIGRNKGLDTALLFGASSHHTVTIQPKAKWHYTDTLNWAQGGTFFTDYTPHDNLLISSTNTDIANFMPLLVLPGDPGSRYQADYADSRGNNEDCPCLSTVVFSSFSTTPHLVLNQSRFNTGMEIVKQVCYLGELHKYILGIGLQDSLEIRHSSFLTFPYSYSNVVITDSNNHESLEGYFYFQDYKGEKDYQAEFTYEKISDLVRNYFVRPENIREWKEDTQDSQMAYLQAVDGMTQVKFKLVFQKSKKNGVASFIKLQVERDKK